MQPFFNTCTFLGNGVFVPVSISISISMTTGRGLVVHIARLERRNVASKILDAVSVSAMSWGRRLLKRGFWALRRLRVLNSSLLAIRAPRTGGLRGIVFIWEKLEARLVGTLWYGSGEWVGGPEARVAVVPTGSGRYFLCT